MSITAAELKRNLSKYLLLSATEDIYVTGNGKTVCKLTNPFSGQSRYGKGIFRNIARYNVFGESKRKIPRPCMRVIADT